MKRRAFTLIEVLASMAVLMVLTLALTRMFISASDITSRGMTSIARNSVGESAMEAILQELDCMVINERIACCKIADTVENRFDTIYFIGTKGDNFEADEMPYQYFNFFVKPVVATNSLGAVYKHFELRLSRVRMGTAAGRKIYALLESDKEWWIPFDDEFSLSEQDQEVLAENVVGFEVYCQDWATGQDLNSPGTIRWNGGNRTFFSSAKSMSIKDKTGHSIVVSNLPPVAFDVKLKVTSPEAAMEGGMLLAAGGSDNEQRGWELMNREASTLFGRAMPMMGATQFRLQRRSYNPVSHYYSEEN